MDNTISELGSKHLENLQLKRDHNTSASLGLILLNNIKERCLVDNTAECSNGINYKQVYDETVIETLLLSGKLKRSSNVKVIVDGRIAFLKKNPQNCSIEEWEIIAYGICKEIGFKVSVEGITKKQCDLAFEITKEIISPKCLIPLFIVDKLEQCKPDYVITKRTQEQCETDFNLFIEQVDNCDLTFAEYYSLNKKGLNFNALREIYNNALSVRLVDGKVQVIGKVNSYTVGEDINYDNNTLVTAVNDRITYLKKITEDLNLPEEIIKELFSN
jgi:hypothetical protein